MSFVAPIYGLLRCKTQVIVIFKSSELLNLSANLGWVVNVTPRPLYPRA